MKGLADKPNYIIELLEGGVTLEDVIDGHICEQTLVDKNAFVVGDLGALMRQHVCWQSVAPRLQPYYPVKCNSSPAVIEVLASLGLGFVCASKAELSLVLEHGVPPENIVLLGVFKQLTFIKHAAKNNVQHLVCESEAELSKIARLHPNAKLLLQLATEAHAAETSMAFGSSLKSCRHLLEAAKELGLQVVGVTFHVPSSCQDLQQAYTRSLSDARCVFDMGVDLGFNMNILDIGGGFTGSECQLAQVESAVRPLLDAYFPQLSGVQVLAQPGNFYVASAFSLAVSVIGKKAGNRHLDSLAQGENNEDTEFLYYMNEGVYGPFSCKLLGNAIAAPSVHKHALCSGEAVYPSSLCGPSLDQLDQVVERCLLPELSVGDWLLFSNMGVCGLDEFSCLSSSSQLPVYYTVSTPDWYEMQEAGVVLDSALKNFSMLQYSANGKQPGLVMTGTKCAEDSICFNGECRNASFLRADECNAKCHGHGLCNNNHNCHCDPGWAPPLCDQPGSGGSVDSGPVISHSGLLRVLLALPLALFALLAAAGLWCCYKHKLRPLKAPVPPPVPNCSIPVETKPLQADGDVAGHTNPTFLLKKQDGDHLGTSSPRPSPSCPARSRQAIVRPAVKPPPVPAYASEQRQQTPTPQPAPGTPCQKQCSPQALKPTQFKGQKPPQTSGTTPLPSLNHENHSEPSAKSKPRPEPPSRPPPPCPVNPSVVQHQGKGLQVTTNALQRGKAALVPSAGQKKPNRS